MSGWTMNYANEVLMNMSDSEWINHDHRHHAWPHVGESGDSILIWSSSTGYLALMLTKGAQVDLSSTHQFWAPLVNISTKYPALPDHDSMKNLSL